MSSKRVVCPICKNPFEYDGIGDTECPVCGYEIKKEDIGKKAVKEAAASEAELYRLMSSADAYFSGKRYDEAYIGYGAVISRDPECIKAIFRRALASQYLTYDCSSVYLGFDGFFAEIEDIKKRIDINAGSDEESDRLKLTVCSDMIGYISYRTDYEKKFAEADEDLKKSGIYTSNLILLFEYTEEILKYMLGIGTGFDRNLAFAVVSCCNAGKKIYNILFGDDREDGVFNTGMLNGGDRMKMETLCENMETTRADIIKNADEALLNRINISEEKKDVRSESGADEFRRKEYEQWRIRNREKYIAADKEILIFGISAKAALCFTAVMAVLFVFEAAMHDEFMKGAAACSLIFFAAQAVFTILRKNAEKKKSYYFNMLNRNAAAGESRHSI